MWEPLAKLRLGGIPPPPAAMLHLCTLCCCAGHLCQSSLMLGVHASAHRFGCCACRAAGIECELDGKRGFDHGHFIPLKLMYPSADIPTVELSLLSSLDPEVSVAGLSKHWGSEAIQGVNQGPG